ncbi:MAG: hypothetical protein IE916_00525 [Epsilonproteobacteria bacterium]|nr:hypothetical protein [Campylobacterota bacterium]
MAKKVLWCPRNCGIIHIEEPTEGKCECGSSDIQDTIGILRHRFGKLV